MHVVLLPPPPLCLPSSWPLPHPELAPLSPEPEVAEDVRGGGAGGGPELSLTSLSEDWTSRAWLGLEQLLRLLVVERERWAGPEPRPGLARALGLGGRRSLAAASSSASLLMPELHSSLTLSLSLCRAMSANSSRANIGFKFWHSIVWKIPRLRKI